MRPRCTVPVLAEGSKEGVVGLVIVSVEGIRPDSFHERLIELTSGFWELNLARIE